MITPPSGEVAMASPGDGEVSRGLPTSTSLCSAAFRLASMRSTTPLTETGRDYSEFDCGPAPQRVPDGSAVGSWF